LTKADFYYILLIGDLNLIKTYKELISDGITDKNIKNMILEEKLFKIEKGYYSSSKTYEEIELITKKYPNSIITLDSAFYYYGLSNIKPNKYHLATLHKAKVIKNDKIKQLFIKEKIFDIGKSILNYNNIMINIYDKERLLIELIRNKNKFDIYYYEEIINNYKKIVNYLDINKIYSYLDNFTYNEKILEEIERELYENNAYKEVNMKGIVLAGGSGTRLYPITEGVSKQLLPIYDKPMIYYPISVLMLAGIKDILIITTEEDQPAFKRLLKDGSQFGVNFEYIIQPSPDGLAQAFILGEEFIGDNTAALVLGDNIFYGNGFVKMLENAVKNAEKGIATNFGIEVPDPERFGIMEIEKTDDGVKVLSVEEKPKNPKSNYAITGLYFYPKGVSKKAKEIKPSARGELEITSLNDMYLKEEKLHAELLGGGFNWYDTGTFDSLFDGIAQIKSYQKNRGRIIACLEQIAYNNGWINDEQLMERANLLQKNSYGKYLKEISEEKRKVLTK